jgi:multiple sugar transport system substrate-binding protein
VAYSAEFGNAGYLEDITDKLDPALKKDMQAALDCVSYKDRIYGLPRFLSIRSFYYNTRMFQDAGLDPKAPPTNWDQLLTAAKKTTRDLNGDGKADQWGFLGEYGRENSCVMLFQELLTTTGEKMFDNQDNPTFGSANGILVMEKLAELHKLGLVDPASFGISSGSDKRTAYSQGKSAMQLGWAADYNVANDPKISKVVGQINFALVPGIKLRSGAMSGSEGYAISKFSKNKDVALDFLKFIANAENQKAMAINTGWMPVRQSVFADPELRKANPLVAQTEQQIQYPVYRFAAPYAEEVTNAVGPEILKVVKLEKDPQAAIKDAVAAAKEIVKRYK